MTANSIEAVSACWRPQFIHEGNIMRTTLAVTLCIAGALTITLATINAGQTDSLDELLAVQAPDEPGNRFPITVTYVVDGDTLDAVINLGWHVSLTSRIRCSDYDSWEKSKRRRSVTVTDDEVAKGKAATEFLTAFLQDREAWLGPDTAGQDRDNYGRILGRVFVRTDAGAVESLAAIMRRLGHLRPTEPDHAARPARELPDATDRQSAGRSTAVSG